MKKRILIEIKSILKIELNKENLEEYYDVVYDFCMIKYGETSSETEYIINNLF
jgi:hypothetical protein